MTTQTENKITIGSIVRSPANNNAIAKVIKQRGNIFTCKQVGIYKGWYFGAEAHELEMATIDELMEALKETEKQLDYYQDAMSAVIGFLTNDRFTKCNTRLTSVFEHIGKTWQRRKDETEEDDCRIAWEWDRYWNAVSCGDDDEDYEELNMEGDRNE